MFKGRETIKKAKIGELYEAIVVTADSERTVRLFALSARCVKGEQQASFFDLVC
jgi:hypothetical protein